MAGKLLFRDAPVYVWADSAKILPETNEFNNIGTSSTSAEIRPDPKAFRPALKWQWLEGNVVSTPVVGPLTDTNGDGKFDSKDIPTVLTVLGLGIDGAPGMLTALSGDDGHKLWQVSDSSRYVMATGQLAFGDLDGTGRSQIASYMQGGGLGIFENDGSLRCRNATPGFAWPYNYGGPTIADLDGDGKAEIILHNYVLNSDCTIRHVLGTTRPEDTWSSVVADLDLDGKPEIITGWGVFRWDGTPYWQQTRMGRLAVARLDPKDPHPQVISVYAARMTVYRHDGSIMWGPVFVNGRNGGAPTVADFAGDGSIGIGVAGESTYVIYNTDGSIKWSKPINDGSGATGATAFDFDGSGNPKIVYADEQNLYVLNGKNGATEFSTTNVSATAGEYPIVADVDGDCHADILVASNSGGKNGLHVYQDVNNAWVNTRKIWNQYAYHITNINDDGAIPRVEKNSWDVHNTYRLNARPRYSATAVPEGTASLVRVNYKRGTAASTNTERLGNASSLELPAGIKVALYNGAAGNILLGKAETSRSLASGEYEDVAFSLSGSLAGIATITVVADDDGSGKAALTDFDRKNNAVSLPLSSVPTMPGLVVQTDLALYGAAQDVQITATIANGTSFDTTARVRFLIMTADNQLVATLPLTGLQVGSNGQATAIATWNTGATLVAGYQVKAQLVDSIGQAVVEASAPFSLQTGMLSLAASLSTDKQVYLPSDTVRLAARAANRNPNALLDKLSTITTVVNPDGSVRFERIEALAQLGQSASRDFAYSLALGNAPSGVYRARFDVKDAGGTLLATAQAVFSVASTADSGAGLAGTITASPLPVPQGDSLLLSFSVSNQGNSALAKLPLTVRIIDPQAGKEEMTGTFEQALAVGGVYHGATNWIANGVVGKTYVAVLQATVGGKAITLAQTNITVSARTAAPVDLGVEQGLATGSRVLVLVSCDCEHDYGHGYSDRDQDDNDSYLSRTGKPDYCTTAQTTAISAMLTALRVTYTIATDETKFKYALRSGAYNTYWLSGKQDKLHDDLAGEVREAVFGGDALILDGVHDERNKVLDAVPSIIYRGKLGERDLPVAIGGPDFSAQRLSSSGQGLKILLDGGVQQGAFDGSRPNTDGPAMVSYAYGQGRGVMFAFDLVESYMDEKRWLPVLGTALKLSSPGRRTDFTPGALVHVRTSIANRAGAVDLQVRSTWSAGAVAIAAQPTATFDNSARIVNWAFKLPESGTQELYLNLRAPLVSGDGKVDTVVSVARDGKVTPYGEALVLPFKVIAAAQRTTLTVEALRALALSGKNAKARDAVVKLVQGAQSAAAKNTAAGYAQAISGLVDAGGQLTELTGADTRAVHVHITQLLKEAEWRWSLVAPAQ